MGRRLDERCVLWFNGEMVCSPGVFLSDLTLSVADARLMVAFVAATFTDVELQTLVGLDTWRELEEVVAPRYKEWMRGLETIQQ